MEATTTMTTPRYLPSIFSCKESPRFPPRSLNHLPEASRPSVLLQTTSCPFVLDSESHHRIFKTLFPHPSLPPPPPSFLRLISISRRRRAAPFLNHSALFSTSSMAMMERPAQGCLGDYIRALEEERNKIEVFQRELPLCLQLITQAIEIARLQMANNRPVLEESLSLRRSPTSTEEEEEEAPSETKPDWFISLQLQNQEWPKKPTAVSLKKTGGGAFRPFERENRRATTTAVTAASSSATVMAEGDGDNDEDVVVVDKDKGKKEGEAQSHRKVRRCWSPELHRRFLIALNHLGGSHAATPKQIREMMKVDGLTNDEIKSHLQKYRLHHRRPSPASQSSSGHGYQQPPHLVLIGGILVQPPEYVVATGAVAQPAAIYTPALSNLPPPDAGVNATSPATSATTVDSI